MEADIIVFATPIYLGDVSGQLKVFIDRMFPKYKEIKNKDIYIIATCAEDIKEEISGAIVTIKGLLECLSNVKLKDVVYAIGLQGLGEAISSKAYEEAYNLGKNI